MLYCGLDLASPSSYAFVTDDKGRKLFAGPVPTTVPDLTRRLGPYVRDGLTIAVEAGNQTAWVHDTLVALGAAVVVVNAGKVRLIAESRKKTDRVDAKILCDLLRLDGLPTPVHVPAAPARELRGLLAARRQLVQARTKLCNVVRGMLRQEGIQLPARGLTSAAGWDRLTRVAFTKAHLPVVVAAYHASFLALTASLKDLDRELAAREKALPQAARLRTMPGVGRIAALTLVAAVDDVTRFPTAKKLIGYTGLAPTVRASGERASYGPITREGRGEIRTVWVQVAQQVGLNPKVKTSPLRVWFAQVAKRRGKKTAVVALTRKLLTIAYHLLRDGCDYDPDKVGLAA